MGGGGGYSRGKGTKIRKTNRPRRENNQKNNKKQQEKEKKKKEEGRGGGGGGGGVFCRSKVTMIENAKRPLRWNYQLIDRQRTATN